MKPIVVGSLESSDCLITLTPSKTTTITIESIVYDAFGDAIEQVIKQTLKHHGLHDVHVYVQDKGALDYAIEARLTSAIKRYRSEADES